MAEGLPPLVKAVLAPLLRDCRTPGEVLAVLVPVCAAALHHVKAEPAHVVQFFQRVTALLDQADG